MLFAGLLTQPSSYMFVDVTETERQIMLVNTNTTTTHSEQTSELPIVIAICE